MHTRVWARTAPRRNPQIFRGLSSARSRSLPDAATQQTRPPGGQALRRARVAEPPTAAITAPAFRDEPYLRVAWSVLLVVTDGLVPGAPAARCHSVIGLAGRRADARARRATRRSGLARRRTGFRAKRLRSSLASSIASPRWRLDSSGLPWNLHADEPGQGARRRDCVGNHGFHPARGDRPSLHTVAGAAHGLARGVSWCTAASPPCDHAV